MSVLRMGLFARMQEACIFISWRLPPLLYIDTRRGVTDIVSRPLTTDLIGSQVALTRHLSTASLGSSGKGTDSPAHLQDKKGRPATLLSQQSPQWCGYYLDRSFRDRAVKRSSLKSNFQLSCTSSVGSPGTGELSTPQGVMFPCQPGQGP
uniref:Uncharacterized protein n=1 Tax=Timema genevievae TaxID=629358 RepID=A0A7R9PN22_TIMGE|nr:unnamed protein product [Timema genevievae]